MGGLLFLLGALIALGAGLLTPIFIIVKGIKTYQLVNRDRNVYVFKTLIILGVWLALSLGMMFLMFVYVFSSAHRKPNDPTNWGWLLVFISLTLAYGAIGWGLVRWMMRRE